MTSTKDYGFEPRGLPGWRVFLERDRFGSRWVFTRPADFPRTFSWSDETQDHTLPVFDDWRGPYVGPECKTAGAAVAAAHRFRQRILDHMAEKKIIA